MCVLGYSYKPPPLQRPTAEMQNEQQQSSTEATQGCLSKTLRLLHSAVSIASMEMEDKVIALKINTRFLIVL